FHGLVVEPPELELARIHGAREEPQVRNRGDAGAERRTEHLDAVIAADERMDGVARDALAGIDAKASFHRMLDHHAHLDGIAAGDAFRQLDARDGHSLSVQAASRTSTWRAADQNVPSESSAMATTRWLPFRRMREATSARTARGPR